MKKYLITSQDFYTDNIEVFNKKLKQQFQTHMPEYALLRDKQTSRYEELASGFVDICKEFGVKSFLHQYVELASTLNADGVHLTSTQFEEILYAKEIGLEVIISTHSHEEVLYAQRLGADEVTYSPIFASPNKGEPKGVDDLKELLKKCSIKVFALGGIVEARHLKMVEETGAYGFASIRYFEE
jgi:thiamine-phosphate pyrophosphorylase